MKILIKLLRALPPLVLASMAPAYAHADAHHPQAFTGRTHAEVLADYLVALPNVARESHSHSTYSPRTRAEMMADYDKALPAAKPDQSSLSVQVPNQRTPTQILVELDKS